MQTKMTTFFHTSICVHLSFPPLLSSPNLQTNTVESPQSQLLKRFGESKVYLCALCTVTLSFVSTFFARLTENLRLSQTFGIPFMFMRNTIGHPAPLPPMLSFSFAAWVVILIPWYFPCSLFGSLFLTTAYVLWLPCGFVVWWMGPSSS